MKTSEKAKIELQKLIQLFESGQALNTMARTYLTSGGMPSSRWTFSNRILAFAQSGERDCRGFRQWQEVKRKVKKGMKAVYILRPVLVKDPNDNEEEICIGFACVPVFPYSATEGEPLPDLTPPDPPPLIDVAEQFGVKIEYEGFGGSYAGSFARDTITLCTHDEQVFFHELAHAAHEKVMGRKLIGGQDSKQEIVAELSACTLARLYGKKQANELETLNYIKQYAEIENKNLGTMILKVLGDVEKVLILITETKGAVDGEMSLVRQG